MLLAPHRTSQERLWASPGGNSCLIHLWIYVGHDRTPPPLPPTHPRLPLSRFVKKSCHIDRVPRNLTSRRHVLHPQPSSPPPPPPLDVLLPVRPWAGLLPSQSKGTSRPLPRQRRMMPLQRNGIFQVHPAGQNSDRAIFPLTLVRLRIVSCSYLTPSWAGPTHIAPPSPCLAPAARAQENYLFGTWETGLFGPEQIQFESRVGAGVGATLQSCRDLLSTSSSDQLLLHFTGLPSNHHKLICH